MRRSLRILLPVALVVVAIAAGLIWLDSDPAGSAATPPPSDPPSTGSSPSASPSLGHAGGGETVTVAAAGDIACDPANPQFNDGRGAPGWCQQEKTADVVRALDPDAVLALGDLQYDDGTLAKFRRVYDKSWGRFKNITYPVPGNHEYWTGSPDGYFDYFGKAAGPRRWGWYDVRLGEWDLFALNTNCEFGVPCQKHSEQWRWLSDQLDSSDATCQLAFFHHPISSSGPHAPGDKAVAPMWDLLDRHGVDLVVTGHDHIYERFAPLNAQARVDPDGIPEFVVGTGGGQLYKVTDKQPGSKVRNMKAFGVLKLTLAPDSYGWKFLPIKGSSFHDAGNQDCT